MDDNIVSKKIIDGVEIIEYKDGHTTFKAIMDKPVIQQKQEEEKSWFGKVIDWFKTAPVTPYAKFRDLADPFGDRRRDDDDIDVGSDGKTAVEVGIKIRF